MIQDLFHLSFINIVTTENRNALNLSDGIFKKIVCKEKYDFLVL